MRYYDRVKYQNREWLVTKVLPDDSCLIMSLDTTRPDEMLVPGTELETISTLADRLLEVKTDHELKKILADAFKESKPKKRRTKKAKDTTEGLDNDISLM